MRRGHRDFHCWNLNTTRQRALVHAFAVNENPSGLNAISQGNIAMDEKLPASATSGRDSGGPLAAATSPDGDNIPKQMSATQAFRVSSTVHQALEG
jgi:hypothetical protein